MFQKNFQNEERHSNKMCKELETNRGYRGNKITKKDNLSSQRFKKNVHPKKQDRMLHIYRWQSGAKKNFQNWEQDKHLFQIDRVFIHMTQIVLTEKKKKC